MAEDKHTYTHLCEHDLDWDEGDIFICNDCGAFAATVPTLTHHKTCVAGDAEKWLKFYEDNPDDAPDLKDR